MKTILTTMMILLAAKFSAKASNELNDIKKVAERFIEVVDKNDAEALKGLLHSDMSQYVSLDGKLIPFKADDFINMVADKKIGGTPRTIRHIDSNIVRNNAAYATLQAVSHEYDFMYQLSLAKQEGEWIIVGIMVDIVKV